MSDRVFEWLAQGYVPFVNVVVCHMNLDFSSPKAHAIIILSKNIT